MRTIATVAICLMALVATPAARAHGDIDARIVELDARIAIENRDAALFIKRGELHRINLHWAEALADYRSAEQLTPADPELHFYRGRMLYESGQPAAAVVELDRYLAIYPEHLEALLVRAETRANLGQFEGAAADYSASIVGRKHPIPEHFLEWAAALSAADGDRDRAVSALDEGVRRLGPLITLQTRAIEYETELGRYDEALKRLGTIEPWLRPERYEARRADLLLSAGRRQEAELSYQAALQALQSLPPARRRFKPVVDFQRTVETALEALQSGD